MGTFEDYQATIARVYGQNNNVIGTGFLVAPQYLLTCAHVVIGALELKTTDFPQKTLTVDFPEGMISFLKAEVILWQPCPSYFQTKLANIKPGEDIALLKLEQPVNLQPIPIQSLETVHNLAFKIWGFPKPNGEETEGTILARQSSRQWYQLQIAQGPIVGGFSGSPLWSPTQQSIIGMTVAVNSVHNPDTNIGGRDANAIAGSELYELWHKQGELIAILETVAWQIIRDAYQLARKHYDSTTKWFTEEAQTLAGAIADLYEMQKQADLDEMQKQLGQNHQLAFVVYLLTLDESKLNKSVKDSLQTWAKTHFPGFEAIKQEISQRIRFNSDQDTDESRLWIILKPGATSDCYFLETAYFIQNLKNYSSQTKPDQTFNLDCREIAKSNFNEEIAPILTAICREIPNTVTNLIIEVFLPFRDLDFAPDQWLLEDEYEEELFPLGSEFPVVLRILERVPGYGNDYSQQGIWLKQWQQRKLDQVSQQVLICTTSEPSQIIIALESFEVSGLRSAYPPSEHQGKPKPQALVMKQGIPFWLWVRKPLDSCNKCEVFAEELLKRVNLRQLPQRLRAIRNDALNDPNHLAAHISFLADNPEKMPDLRTQSYSHP